MRESGPDAIRPRVVLIGDSSVGKTSILSRLIDHRFDKEESATIGATYQLYHSTFEGRTIELQIWDTAGEERFRALGPIYYRNAWGAIAVFDVTNRASFQNLDAWIDLFHDTAGDETLVVLAANKIDDVARDVSLKDALAYAENQFKVYETSALTGDGIQKLFDELSRDLAQSPRARPRPEAAPVVNETPGCHC
jgi:small GTP-binding protein